MPLVVVDPGHGGTDPGTVGNGLQEKNITLEAGIALRDALLRCGIQVLMTRTTDTLLLPEGTIGQDLSARANLANQNQANLYISWHVDSFNNPDVNGVATWIYPTTRGTETETIARMIVDNITSATGQQNRGVYVADFAVLRETNMSAVLIESGFITNAQESSQLAIETFRAKQAEATAKAVCAFFDMPYVAPAKPTPQPTPQIPQPTPQPTPEPPIDPFPNEDMPNWAREAILRVHQAGIMTGFEDGTFRPNEPVTRAQLAVALVRLYDFLKAGKSL